MPQPLSHLPTHPSCTPSPPPTQSPIPRRRPSPPTRTQDAHQLTAALQAHWPDAPAALDAYQLVRVRRTRRIQGLSAESCGDPAIYGALRPKGLTPEEALARSREFTVGRMCVCVCGGGGVAGGPGSASRVAVALGEGATARVRSSRWQAGTGRHGQKHIELSVRSHGTASG